MECPNRGDISADWLVTEKEAEAEFIGARTGRQRQAVGRNLWGRHRFSATFAGNDELAHKPTLHHP